MAGDARLAARMKGVGLFFWGKSGVNFLSGRVGQLGWRRIASVVLRSLALERRRWVLRPGVGGFPNPVWLRKTWGSERPSVLIIEVVRELVVSSTPLGAARFLFEWEIPAKTRTKNESEGGFPFDKFDFCYRISS